MKFTTLSLARSFAGRCAKPQMVILGCDGLFWVVSLADGEKLVLGGYSAV